MSESYFPDINPYESDSNLVQFLYETLGIEPFEALLHLKFHTRNYAPLPEGYCDLPTLARMYAIQALFFPLNAQELANLCVADKARLLTFWSLIMRREEYPTFFANRDLCRDLCASNSPSFIPLELELPDLGIIALPEDILVTKTGSVAAIAYSIFRPEKHSHGALIQSIKEYLPDTVLRDYLLKSLHLTDLEHTFLSWSALETGGISLGGNIYFENEGNRLKTDQLSLNLYEEDDFLDNDQSSGDMALSLLLNMLADHKGVPAGSRTANRLNKKRSHRRRNRVFSPPVYIGNDYSSPISSLPVGSGIDLMPG